MHADALAELVLKRVEGIVRMSFFTQYAICIFYIRNIFAWLSCSPLFFATKNTVSLKVLIPINWLINPRIFM